MFLRVLQQVFSNLRYVIIAVPVALAVFAFAVWLPNWRLIFTVFTSPSVSIAEALQVMFGLFFSIGTNFTTVSGTYTVLVAILFGINIAMLVYYIRVRKASFKGTGPAAGIGGLISGIFGIGCVWRDRFKSQ